MPRKKKSRRRTRPRDLGDFAPSPANPRAIAPEALRALALSLRTFGDLGGFVVNARTGNVICGHQRRRALEGGGVSLSAVKWGAPHRVELGHAGARFASDERDGLVQLPPSRGLAGGARFTVRLVDWPAPFERQATLAANSPLLQGNWTPEASDLVREISAEAARASPAAADLLFEQLADELAAELAADLAGEVSGDHTGAGARQGDLDRGIDDAPELPATPRTAPGDLYTMGPHRLLCADSTSWDALAPLLRSRRADLVFTDPPYNMDYRSKPLGGIRNDSLSEARFVRLILASVDVMLRALRRGGAFYVCMSGLEYATVAHQLRKLGLAHRPIVWVKPHAGLGAQEYRPRFEMILFGHTGRRAARTWNGARRESDVWEFNADRPLVASRAGRGGMSLEFGSGFETLRVILRKRSKGTVLFFDGSTSDVWRFSRERGNYRHPTQKPVALVERAIANSTRPGDLVVDLFAGSGTTFVACERTGRVCHGVELDPRYCDVVVDRWEGVTGRKAEKVGGPK